MTAAHKDWSSSGSPELGLQGTLRRWFIPLCPVQAAAQPPCTLETVPHQPGYQGAGGDGAKGFAKQVPSTWDLLRVAKLEPP